MFYEINSAQLWLNVLLPNVSYALMVRNENITLKYCEIIPWVLINKKSTLDQAKAFNVVSQTTTN